MGFPASRNIFKVGNKNIEKGVNLVQRYRTNSFDVVLMFSLLTIVCSVKVFSKNSYGNQSIDLFQLTGLNMIQAFTESYYQTD